MCGYCVCSHTIRRYAILLRLLQGCAAAISENANNFSVRYFDEWWTPFQCVVFCSHSFQVWPWIVEWCCLFICDKPCCYLFYLFNRYFRFSKINNEAALRDRFKEKNKKKKSANLSILSMNCLEMIDVHASFNFGLTISLAEHRRRDCAIYLAHRWNHDYSKAFCLLALVCTW